MKTKHLLTIFMISAFSLGMSAQGITNDGAVITITTGTHFVIQNGNYLNQTNTTDGSIDLDGTLYVDGNFTNNAANNVFINRDTDGTVVFNGTGTQTITTNAADMSNFVDFEAVTVNLGSNTDLVAGSAATINGVLNINGALTLKSPVDKTPSGSLITATGVGSITGTGDITVERYFKVNGQWQYVSSPIIGQQSDIFTENTFSGNFNPNFYTYNEAYDEPTNPVDIAYSNYDYGGSFGFWQAWEQVQATVGVPVTINTEDNNRTGYIVYNEGDINAVFTSTNPSDLNNNASYVPTMLFTANDGNSDYYDGWNLVGNPYSSALNWDAIHLGTTNINDCAYMWDGDLGNYVYYNGGSGSSYQFTGQTLNSTLNGTIPSTQSFFVKATAAPTFSIPASARVHNSLSMYKGTESYEFNFVRLQVEFNGKTDETIVRFFDSANSNFDNNFDSYKFYAQTEGLPQIYSVMFDGQEIPLSFNTLPTDALSEDIIVPIGLVVKADGQYIIRANEINDVNFGGTMLLYDTKVYNEASGIFETVVTDLADTEYTFSAQKGEYRDRFFLFGGPQSSGINDDEQPNADLETSVNVWSSENNVYITLSSYNLIDANVKIFDMLGRTVIDQNLTGAYNIVNVPGASGTYFVKLKTKDGKIRTDKVFIQK
ncbi:MAG: T9SS type A sorting domain-containing protein [Bacteroidales bacterium]|nr:T9SS type A sorting domain-containing protein [Bacteroidales bacterium]